MNSPADRLRLEPYKDAVREANPIEEIAGEYTSLKPSGQVLRGICPLPGHDDTNPSFTVYSETGSFSCFGCHRGGDVFNLVMLYENLTFVEALRKLGERGGVKPPDFPADTWDRWVKAEEERRSLCEILTLAAVYYNSKLTTEFRNIYYKNYSFTDETIDKLKLGYSDGNLIDHLTKQCGIPLDEVLKTGLAVKTPEGVKNFFTGRLVFPYWKNGKVVYFVGRKTEHTPDASWERGKYKKLLTHSEHHSYVSPLIKNLYFYNEDAVLLARRAGRLLVTEGVTDCIAANQAGIPCISPVTTTISEEMWPRFLQLIRGIPMVHICNDNEGNGEGEKGALETAARLFKETLLEAKLIVLPRPEGIDKIDLNDYLKSHSPDDFEQLSQQSTRFIERQICQIPSTMAKIELLENLEQVFELMALLPPVQTAIYLNHVLKKRFGLTAKETEGFRKYISQLSKSIPQECQKTSQTEIEEEEEVVVEKAKEEADKTRSDGSI